MKKSSLLLAGLGLLALTACQNPPAEQAGTTATEVVAEWPRAVTYEIFVQSFADSDGDGIGDIPGMTSRLDYLQDLGIKAVWLMPIHPSPSYHKYDVTDYYGIHPDYGTMDDFKTFVEQAHARDIRVVIDLVINHTAREHPWFQEAMANPDSPFRDFYVWAEKDSIADQIAKKETALDSDNITQWHDAPGNQQAYYGYFWGGMPDLNFDNPAVKEEIFQTGRFWLEEVGVDGFRLDAARHIFPDERAEDNHAWWQEFRAEMEEVKEDVYLIGEVWAPTEEVAPYLKGLHALFNFDMSYAMTKAAQQEQASGLVSSHKEIRDYYQNVTPDFIDATFLTNHDQNRIMSELGGDINKAKMASSLLFTLPGTPYIYYGEEIGMLGTKPDEQIREPFLWNLKDQDKQRASWIEPQYSTDQTVQPLALQQQDTTSIYHHYKKMIALRNGSAALTFGQLEEVAHENPQLVVFRRSGKGESLLVYHNLSAVEQRYSLGEADSSYNEQYFSSTAGARISEAMVTLPPYSSLILKKAQVN